MPAYDFICVAFKPQVLRAFSSPSGYHFRHDAAEIAGITNLDVRITVIVDNLGQDKELSISCKYDLEALPSLAFGHPTEDLQLRRSLAELLSRTFGFDTPPQELLYLPRWQQHEGFILLESGSSVVQQMNQMSGHDWIEVMANPEIQEVSFGASDLAPNREPSYA